MPYVHVCTLYAGGMLNVSLVHFPWYLGFLGVSRRAKSWDLLWGGSLAEVYYIMARPPCSGIGMYCMINDMW